MKVKGYNSTREHNLKEADYLIDWNHKVSGPQKAVKDALYPYWKGAVVGEEVRIPGSKTRLDLVNFSRRIVIEISPESSHSFNRFFHKTRFGFAAAVRRDLDKEKWCKDNRFVYIELTQEDLDNLSQSLLKELGAI